jgi:methyl-accepting chemotaxis protein
MLKNYSVGVKLGLSVGISLVFMIIIGVNGLVYLKKGTNALETVYNDRVVCLKQLKMVADMYAVNIVDTCHEVRNGNLSWEQGLKNFDEANKVIVEQWRAYSSTSLIGDEKKLMEEAVVLMQKADVSIGRVREIMERKDAEQLAAYTIHDLYPNIDPISDKVGELVDLQLDVAKKEHDAGMERYGHSRALGILVMVGGLLFSGIFSFLIARNLVTRMVRVSKAMEKVADGDLSLRLKIYANDEFGALGRAINEMLESMCGVISAIRNSSEHVASAATQLMSTSEQIATGAEEVAAQAGTVATASEEMSATSNDIARNCTMAAEASQQSSDSAHSGAQVVQEAITGMGIIAERVRSTSKTIEALGARSEQIGDIVGTIEDIADQTNLLALNAAIEAARAGEQGRGFAVVADEVRALAERTAKATREIGGMIKTIQAETSEAVRSMEEGVVEAEKGASSAEKSGEALKEIIDHINEVAMQVSQIATAAEQQTATTGEVTSNIQQITDVVHQTARGAEDTSGAAAQLAQQAQELQALVGHFKVS